MSRVYESVTDISEPLRLYLINLQKGELRNQSAISNLDYHNVPQNTLLNNTERFQKISLDVERVDTNKENVNKKLFEQEIKNASFQITNS